MTTAGVVVFTHHGVPALGAVLRDLRASLAQGTEVAVFARDCPEQVATYLVRQYLRGRLTGFELDHGDHLHGHCGLDLACHLVDGEYLARVDDTLRFQPGWLEQAAAVLDAEPDIGCLSLVPPPGYRRRRGRPPTRNVRPLPVERVDMRCFVTRAPLVRELGCESVETPPEACVFLAALRRQGWRLAYLPGLVTALPAEALPGSGDGRVHEADLPLHGDATGSVQRLRQAWRLGDDVLLPCVACDARTLEVLAARVKFCEAHQAALGHWYELKCPECGELQYRDDLQFRCPG